MVIENIFLPLKKDKIQFILRNLDIGVNNILDIKLFNFKGFSTSTSFSFVRIFENKCR